jgi:hypothetical protein
MKQLEEKPITRKQQALIVAMLEHHTMSDAIKAASVSKATAYRWLKSDPVFQRQWNDAKRETYSQAITFLTKSATVFAKVLLSIALDKDSPKTARVSAARAGLEWSTRGIERYKIVKDAERIKHGLTPEEIKEIKQLILTAYDRSNKTESPNWTPFVPDPNRPQAYNDLCVRISGIADRLRGHIQRPNTHTGLPGPGPARDAASAKVEPEIPLHQLLKDLMRKASTKRNE